MSSQLDKIFDEDYPWDRDSLTYKELENRVKYMGLYVTESGYVFRKDGKQVKPKYVFKTLEDGTKRIQTVNIGFSHKGQRHYKSYQRFVYAAWNPDFDIDDKSLIVVSETPNRFEFNPNKLKVITRAEHLENLRVANMKYTDEEREIIAKEYYKVKGRITQEEYANTFEISQVTLLEILKEYPDEG